MDYEIIERETDEMADTVEIVTETDEEMSGAEDELLVAEVEVVTEAEEDMVEAKAEEDVIEAEAEEDVIEAEAEEDVIEAEAEEEWVEAEEDILESRDDVSGTNGEMTGTVKWFSRMKGWGFIEPDQGERDVFVHYENILGEGFKNLEKGERVQFQVLDTPKGPKALEVSSLM